MRTLLMSFTLALTFAFAGTGYAQLTKPNLQYDTLKLRADSNRNVYYQKTVTTQINLTADRIYERVIQFMAAKNMVQTYGDDQQWKAIFSTTQDLNTNPVYIGDDNDTVDPYSAQFAVIVDIKNGRYRYTVNNILFFIPTVSGNRRETLYEMYAKATNTDSKRVAKNARMLIMSFERYLSVFTDELRQGIEQTAPMYNSKF
jgi:hypothetical protein